MKIIPSQHGITLIEEEKEELKSRRQIAQKIRAVRRAYRAARRINPNAYAHLPQGFADRELLCKIFGMGKSTVTALAQKHDIFPLRITVTRNVFGRTKPHKINAWSLNDFCRAYILKYTHA